MVPFHQLERLPAVPISGHRAKSVLKCCNKTLFSQYHTELIASAALLRADNFMIKTSGECRSRKANFGTTFKQVTHIISRLSPPPVFKRKEGVRIAGNDTELESMNNNESVGDLEEVFRKCRAVTLSPSRPPPIIGPRTTVSGWLTISKAT